MKMKIMVAYDGANVTNHALEVAVSHAKAFDAEILVVTSMEGGANVPRADFETAERNLLRAEKFMKDEQVTCETRLSVRGLTAGEDLVKLAAEEKAGEIFIGVRRRSKVGKLVFGSTAQYVILKSPCPVVSVR
jgi:nucleotide-binding universal stress UspA family protein